MAEFITEWMPDSHKYMEAIVRCRDCKWFTPEHRYEEEREYGVMEELVEPPDCGNPERCSHHYDSIAGKVVPVHIVTDPDGFCAWGERGWLTCKCGEDIETNGCEWAVCPRCGRMVIA